MRCSPVRGAGGRGKGTLPFSVTTQWTVACAFFPVFSHGALGPGLPPFLALSGLCLLSLRPLGRTCQTSAGRCRSWPCLQQRKEDLSDQKVSRPWLPGVLIGASLGPAPVCGVHRACTPRGCSPAIPIYGATSSWLEGVGFAGPAPKVRGKGPWPRGGGWGSGYFPSIYFPTLQ